MDDTIDDSDAPNHGLNEDHNALSIVTSDEDDVIEEPLATMHEEDEDNDSLLDLLGQSISRPGTNEV